MVHCCIECLTSTKKKKKTYSTNWNIRSVFIFVRNFEWLVLKSKKKHIFNLGFLRFVFPLLFIFFCFKCMNAVWVCVAVFSIANETTGRNCVVLARMQKLTIKSITSRYEAINRQNNEHCSHPRIRTALIHVRRMRQESGRKKEKKQRNKSMREQKTHTHKHWI